MFGFDDLQLDIYLGSRTTVRNEAFDEGRRYLTSESEFFCWYNVIILIFLIMPLDVAHKSYLIYFFYGGSIFAYKLRCGYEFLVSATLQLVARVRDCSLLHFRFSYYSYFLSFSVIVLRTLLYFSNYWISFSVDLCLYRSCLSHRFLLVFCAIISISISFELALIT